MFLKLWVICLVLFLICMYSVVIPIRFKAKKQFTKEELKKWSESRKGLKCAWFVYAFFILTPILNVIIGFSMGVMKEELEYKVLKDIRKANGKQTLADTLDDLVENAFKTK